MKVLLPSPILKGQFLHIRVLKQEACVIHNWQQQRPDELTVNDISQRPLRVRYEYSSFGSSTMRNKKRWLLSTGGVVRHPLLLSSKEPSTTVVRLIIRLRRVSAD